MDNTQALINEMTRKQIAGNPIEVNAETYTLLPEGYTVHKFAKELDAPKRIEARPTLLTVASFIEYYNRFANESSTIYAQTDCARFEAVIDHHDINSPQFGDHRPTYKCPTSTAWTTWTAADRMKMEQADFARFIENNLDDIVNPDGATMLEIALTLQAKTNVDFKQATRLDNGQVVIKYNEQIDGVAGAAGTMQIPYSIQLGIAPLKGGDVYKIEARYRWRINNGQLSMWYELANPEKRFEAAVQDVCKHIKDSMTNGHMIEGHR
ncbi:MAG: YfdQ family protein [Rhodospirillaceae bacterium]|nr:YfdQ family protein [Rhodospirillaceae bacterium]